MGYTITMGAITSVGTLTTCAEVYLNKESVWREDHSDVIKVAAKILFHK
jgi:hypothetical protein